jgi:hypothetical protein
VFVRTALKTKTSLVLGLFALLGLAIGGCTPAVMDELGKTELEQFPIDDVAEIDGPTPGLRTVIVTDWRYESMPSTEPMTHRTRKKDPCAESNTYKFLSRGLRWQSSPVTYRFTDAPNEEWKAAVRRAFETYNAAGTNLIFQESETSNNLIGWAPLDGGGRALAQTAISFISSQKKILSFSITLDSAESWAILGTDTCPNTGGSGIDVENIAAHEIGHAAGLAHSSSSKDRVLTMYPSAASGETLKRSLGAGDRAGLVYLYGTR